MLKIECNSRESIIDFIEHSDKQLLIKAHYQSLVSDILFEKALKVIADLIKKDLAQCTLWYESNAPLPTMEIINKLIKHMKLLGIDVTLKNKKDASAEKKEGIILSDLSEPGSFSLHLLSEEGEKQHDACTETSLKEEDRSEDRIFIQLNQMLQHKSKQKPKMQSNVYAFSSYYSCVFSVLQKIYPTRDFEKIIDEFNTQNASSAAAAVKYDIPSRTQIINVKESVLLTLQEKAHQLLNYRSTYVFLFLIVLFSVLFIADYKGNHSNHYLAHTYPIRSDLRISVDSALLSRPHLINQLNSHFTHLAAEKNTSVKIVGIIGIGGAGKTTLARSFAKAQTNGIVWEINAETHASLIDSFMNLSYVLAKTKEVREELNFINNIQNIKEKERQLMLFVKSQLKNSPNWLLIYDNAESFAEIDNFFPHDVNVWGEGKVIITTRDSNILNSSYVDEKNVIQIDQLNQEDALTLFCKILYQKEPKILSSEEKEKVHAFLMKIPPFPLDITVAAHYIKNASLTFDQYSERIAQNSQSFDKGQQAFLKEITDYTQTRYGLITLSITKLIETNPAYKDLLFLICFLDSQNIPFNFLASYKDPALVDQFMRDLKKYSLITSQSGDTNKRKGNEFSLHRSTQLLMKGFLLNQLNGTDQKDSLDISVAGINDYYSKNDRKDYLQLLKMLPHLECFMKNIEALDISDIKKNQYKQDIMYHIGFSHYSATRNLLAAKNYLEQADQLQDVTQYFSNVKLAKLLSHLAEINAELENADEAIIYAQRSLKLCDKTSSLDVLISTNLRIVGFAFTHKNDFKKAIHTLQEALYKSKSIEEPEIRKEIESKINVYMGRLYSGAYINGAMAEEGAQYIHKALKNLGGDKIYYQQSQKPKNILNCSVVRDKVHLGRTYCRLGKYTEANDFCFKDAQFIIDNGLDDCSHNLSKFFIKISVGEIHLRFNQLNEAKSKLLESIQMLKTVMDGNDSSTVEPRVFLTETRIRLGELNEAYNDCLFLFNIKRKTQTNYSTLAYLTSHYHAAVIKQKQKDFKKSWSHFKDFFERVKPLCKVILSDQKYQILNEQKAFDLPLYQEATGNEVVQQCLQQSSAIFSAIYGAEHPFVKDYVLMNSAVVGNV